MRKEVFLYKDNDNLVIIIVVNVYFRLKLQIALSQYLLYYLFLYH